MMVQFFCLEIIIIILIVVVVVLVVVNFAHWFDIWQDVYFDDESAEVVISSLRLGDDQNRYLMTPACESLLLQFFGSQF